MKQKTEMLVGQVLQDQSEVVQLAQLAANQTFLYILKVHQVFRKCKGPAMPSTTIKLVNQYHRRTIFLQL
jgi:hypothetical protein